MELLTHDELVRLTLPERLASISQPWVEARKTRRFQPRPARGRHLGSIEDRAYAALPLGHPVTFTRSASAQLIEAQGWYENEDFVVMP